MVSNLDTILTYVTYALGQVRGIAGARPEDNGRISRAMDALERCQSLLASRTIQVNDWVVCPRCGNREQGSEVYHAAPACPAKIDSGGEFEF
jgi:hypothetical protein